MEKEILTSYVFLTHTTRKGWEDIFVFHRETERERFVCNKPVYDTGHYGWVSNFVTAANSDPSDSPCHARFSSELVMLVLQKYIAAGTRDVTILDPFVGSGTTFRACAQLGFSCVGVELVRAHLDPMCLIGVSESEVIPSPKRIKLSEPHQAF